MWRADIVFLARAAPNVARFGAPTLFFVARSLPGAPEYRARGPQDQSSFRRSARRINQKIRAAKKNARR
jgi:hypothetical protein